MNVTIKEQQRREGGFTLVELAIVMIIIGLLIGGILKGQELIANSQVTATISQIKGIDAAMSTFRDKYAALPGDMNPANRLASCNAAPCNVAGNQNGRIEGVGNVGSGTPLATRESTIAFAHMSAADLLSGVETTGGNASNVFGQLLPDAKVGGGFTGIEYSSTGNLTSANNAAAIRAKPGHYLILTGTPTSVSGASSSLNPGRAAQIDRKIDDGKPNAGSIRGTNAGCAVAAASSSDYNEDNGSGCSLYVRIQG